MRIFAKEEVEEEAETLLRYIFVNMFTGVVVESFAYVYQMPGESSLNREEMRRSFVLVLFGELIYQCRRFQEGLGRV